MLAFIVRRLLSTLLVMGLVGVFIFLLLHLSPGDPAAAFVKANDPDPVAIASLVAGGYIVRTRADADTIEARTGSTVRREAALASAGGRGEDYPFWMLTARSMQYAWGGNVGMQLIKEVADNVAGHRGVIVNAAAARKLGIADGDPIEIATPRRRIRGRAVLRQGIRPDTLLAIGQFDHWATPFAKDFGVPSLNSLVPMSLDLTDATGSGADIVRVKLTRFEK